jgi:putative lipoprotein (rSAM/lipoprotein system)
MKTTRRVFIKKMNWALAGIIGMLGFAGCEKEKEKEKEDEKENGDNNLLEYGSPYADYTVKGAVVNKATKQPIEGIRVGYPDPNVVYALYGPPPASYELKPYVMTNTKGEFKLTGEFFPEENKILPVFVEDIDDENNGLFKPEILQVDFKDAVHSGKSEDWYKGEFTVTLNVELTEIEKE